MLPKRFPILSYLIMTPFDSIHIECFFFYMISVLVLMASRNTIDNIMNACFAEWFSLTAIPSIPYLPP